MENLVDFYLEYNEEHRLHNITTLSIFDDKLPKTADTAQNRYIWQHRGLFDRVAQKVYSRINPDKYYDDATEWHLRWAMKQLRRLKPDAIVVENRPGYGPRLRREFAGTPIVLHLHNDMLAGENGRLADSFDSIIAVSDFLANRVREQNGHARVKTVCNGIDTERFAPRPKNMELRRELGFADDDFVVVYTGRLVPEKGIAELLEAVESMGEASGVKLLVVGGAFYDGTADSDFAVQLKQRTEQMGDRLRFTGFVEYSKVPDYLSVGDAACVPSTWDEPFGLTVAEAMSVGLPVVATRSGGIPEIVNTEHCLLVKGGEGLPQRLSKAIATLRNHYSQYACNTLSPRFTKEHYAEEFFKKLLD